MTELQAAVSRHEPAVRLTPLIGDAFYNRVKAAFGLAASGERRLYGNVIPRQRAIRP